MANLNDNPDWNQLELLFVKNRQELEAIAKSFIGQQLDAFDEQDAVQEAWLRLRDFRFAGEPVDQRYLMGFIIGTIRRVVIDHVRFSNAEKRGGQVCKVPLEQAGGTADSGSESESIEELLQRLTSRQREVFHLVYIEGLTRDGVANELQVSKRTLQLELRAIHDALLRMLEKE